jgi:uncharacterized membrane protein YeaQ/YmgE (transglycosylase-associated protein family)
MEGTQVGWIAAIIIGGIAGWLAGRFMHRNIGMLMSIILGISVRPIVSWLFGLLGIEFGNGWSGYLVAGFIGACILLWMAQWVASTSLSRRLGRAF